MLFLSVSECIGRTPLIHADTLTGGKVELFLKCEIKNPSGSVKDRAAHSILNAALLRGELAPCGRIVEATSGNMGISLAMLGAAMGIGVSIVMPSGMSREREQMMRWYGAVVILTPKEKGMAGAVAAAERIARETGAFYTRQFENEDGVTAHYLTTAPEITESLGRVPDIFIAGVGTGATLTGVARYMKERGRCLAVAVEPSESPVLSGGTAGMHRIQGIGAGFVPRVTDMTLIDLVMTVSYNEAVYYCNSLPSLLGIACGISSGAVIAAAVRLSQEKEHQGRTLVALLPDGRERYMSVGP